MPSGRGGDRRRAPGARDARQTLPIAPQPFQGRIGLTPESSQPAWPSQATTPANAPNVLLILTDDVGFGASSAFGGPIPTPNLDRLATIGLRYNEFDTTAICAPTRAALLTGRNHMPSATVPSRGRHRLSRLLGGHSAKRRDDRGDAQGQWLQHRPFGKHHNMPAWPTSAAGPFNLWPTGLGFEYFYGFMGGESNQWEPRLYRNTVRRIPVNGRRRSTTGLADDAIHWIHQHKAAAPDKPFFLYFATGTAHAPHQAPKEWIERFKASSTSAGTGSATRPSRGRRRGIIPADAVKTPRPADLPAWDSLERRAEALDAR